MNRTTLLVLAAMTLIGCTTPEAHQRQAILQHRRYLEEQARLVTVNPSSGISEVDAYKIGRDRFNTYGTACGAVSTPVDLGDFWRVTTYVGYGSQPCEELLIRKSNGITTIRRLEVPKLSNR